MGQEAAHMDAGNPWVGRGCVPVMMRVSVLLLPSEAGDSHVPLLLPTPASLGC